MQFSYFTRTQVGNTITFKNVKPIVGINSLNFYKDDSSGTFIRKEFRWSFTNTHWSSWEELNQGNFSNIQMKGNTNFYLEVRYVLSAAGSGNVTLFSIFYDGTNQPKLNTPKDAECESSNSVINADTLCGKSCDYYLFRGNHKGTQPISSIENLHQTLFNLSAGIQNSIMDAFNVDASGVGVFYQKENQAL